MEARAERRGRAVAWPKTLEGMTLIIGVALLFMLHADPSSADTGPSLNPTVPLDMARSRNLGRNTAQRRHANYNGEADFGGLQPVTPVDRVPIKSLDDQTVKGCEGSNEDAADCGIHEAQYISAGCSARYSREAPGVGCGDWRDVCETSTDSGCQDATPGPGDVNLAGVAAQPSGSYVAALSASSAPCFDDDGLLCNRGNTTVGKVVAVTTANNALRRHGIAPRAAATSGAGFLLRFDLDHTPSRDSAVEYLRPNDPNPVSVSAWTGRVPFFHDSDLESRRVYTASAAAPFAQIAALSTDIGNEDLVDLAEANELRPVGEDSWANANPLTAERVVTMSEPLLAVSSDSGSATVDALGPAHDDASSSSDFPIDGVYGGTIVRGRHKDAADLIEPTQFEVLTGQSWAPTETIEGQLWPGLRAHGCEATPDNERPPGDYIAIVRRERTVCERDCAEGGHVCAEYECSPDGYQCGATVPSDEYFCRDFACARPVCLQRPCAQWNTDETYCFRFEEEGCDLYSETQCEAEYEVCDQNLNWPMECCDFDFRCERMTRDDPRCEAACSDWEKSNPSACDDPEVVAMVCGGESLRRCPNDCACVVDGVCDAEAGETFANCASDCRCNNDGVCDSPRENYSNCNSDCLCFPDGLCTSQENFGNCPADCPCDFDGVCGSNRVAPPGGAWYPPESYENCPSDCPCNGDGECNGSETLRDCPDENCGVPCDNDGECSPNESCVDCADCFESAECCETEGEAADVCKIDSICDRGGGEDEFNCEDCVPEDVRAAVRVELDIKAYPAGSSERAELVASFIADMAAALGIDESRIFLESITAGSIVFEVSIRGTANPSEPSASHLFEVLVVQVATPGTPFWEGSVTSMADPTFSPEVETTEEGGAVSNVMMCQTTAQSATVRVALDGEAVALGNVEIGTSFKVACPRRCAESTFSSATVYGQGTYTDDSSICRAAVFDGLISSADGGAVEVTIVESPDSFAAASANGIQTVEWSSAVSRAFILGSVCELTGPCDSAECSEYVSSLTARDQCDAAVLETCEYCDFERDNLIATDDSCAMLYEQLASFVMDPYGDDGLHYDDTMMPSFDQVCYNDCWIRMVEAAYQTCKSGCESVPEWFRVSAELSGVDMCDVWRLHLDFICQVNQDTYRPCTDLAERLDEPDGDLSCAALEQDGCCVPSASNLLGEYSRNSQSDYADAWTVINDRLKDATGACSNLESTACSTSLIRFDPEVDGTTFTDDACAATERRVDYSCAASDSSNQFDDYGGGGGGNDFPQNDGGGGGGGNDAPQDDFGGPGGYDDNFGGPGGYNDNYGGPGRRLQYNYEPMEYPDPRFMPEGRYSSDSFQMTLCKVPGMYDMTAQVFGSLPNGQFFAAPDGLVRCSTWLESEAETDDGAWKINLEYNDNGFRVFRFNAREGSAPNTYEITFDAPGSCRPLMSDNAHTEILFHNASASICEARFSDGGGDDGPNDGLNNLPCSGENYFSGEFADSGAFSDGSFPENLYEPNQDCAWLVTVPDGQTATVIHFDRMDIEFHDTCQWDWIKIFNSHDRSSTPLHIFCDSSTPDSILIESSQFAIEFRSDGGTQRTGFMGWWEPAGGGDNGGGVVDGPCSGVYQESLQVGQSLTISDGSAANENHGDNMNCRWQIYAPAGSYIFIHLNRVELECCCDKVRVWDTHEENPPQYLQEVCDMSSGSDITIMPQDGPSTTASISFSSDSSVNNPGFELVVSVEQYVNIAGTHGTKAYQSEPENVAVNDPANDFGGGGGYDDFTGPEDEPAHRAIDGNTARLMSFGSCSSQLPHDDALWHLDLGGVAEIAYIEVFKAADPDLYLDMQGYDILVGDSFDVAQATPCRTNINSGQFGVDIAWCNRAGRHVFLQAHGSNTAFHLCEVRVFSKAVVVPDCGVTLADPMFPSGLNTMTPFFCETSCEEPTDVFGCDVMYADTTSVCAAATFHVEFPSYTPYVARKVAGPNAYNGCENKFGAVSSDEQFPTFSEALVVARAGHYEIGFAGPAAASSVMEPHTPDRAVDGTFSSSASPTCFISQQEANPWWGLELSEEQMVLGVRVNNDDLGSNGLDNFDVLVGGGEDGYGEFLPCDGGGHHVAPGESLDVFCMLPGQFVKIQSAASDGVLRLCEVQIFSYWPEFPDDEWELVLDNPSGASATTKNALVDYNLNTFVESTAGSPITHFIGFDFGVVVPLTTISVSPAHNQGSKLNDVKLQYSNDGGFAWFDVVTLQGFTDFDNMMKTYSFEPVRAELWRLVRFNNGQPIAAGEVSFQLNADAMRRRLAVLREQRRLVAADDISLSDPFLKTNGVVNRVEPVAVSDECRALYGGDGEDDPVDLERFRNRCPFDRSNSYAWRFPCKMPECLHDYCSVECQEVVERYCFDYSYDGGCDLSQRFADCPIVAVDDGEDGPQQKCSPFTQLYFYDSGDVVTITDNQFGPPEEFYAPQSNCVWTIEGPANHQVEVEVIRFDVEFHETCSRDSVSVYGRLPDEDGEFGGDGPLATVCGDETNLPNGGSVFLTPGNQLTIVFHSDVSFEASGFEFRVSFKAPEGPCAGSLNLVAPMTDSGGSPGALLRFGDGTGDTEQMISNAFCEWYVSGDNFGGDVRVILAFLRLSIPAGSTSECHDSGVSVWPSFDLSDDPIGDVCGPSVQNSVGPVVLESLTPSMLVQYRSGFDIPSSFTGWEAVAISQRAFEPILNFQVASSTAEVPLEDTYQLRDGDSETGIATNAEAGSWIEFNFGTPVAITHVRLRAMEPFMNEGFANHEVWYERIDNVFEEAMQPSALFAFDWDNAYWADIMLPETIVAKRVRIQNGPSRLALSEVEFFYEGATAAYSACSGSMTGEFPHVLNAGEEFAFSDGTSPSQDYQNGARCSWKIRAPDGYRLHVDYDRFMLESSSPCVYDWVAIWDGEVDPSSAPSPGYKVCGLSKPGPFTSEGSTITIQFRSDGSVSEPGFEARVFVVDENFESYNGRLLEGVDVASDGRVASSKTLQLPHVTPRHVMDHRDIRVPQRSAQRPPSHLPVENWVREAMSADVSVLFDGQTTSPRFRRLTVDLEDIVFVNIVEREGLLVDAGEDFTLECNVTGAPGASIAWYRGESMDDAVQISGATTSTLTVSDADYDDSDNYFCVANLAEGVSFASPATSVGVQCPNPCPFSCSEYKPVDCPAFQCADGVPLFIEDLLDPDDERVVDGVPPVCSASDGDGAPLFPEFVKCNEPSDHCLSFACDVAEPSCPSNGRKALADHGLTAIPAPDDNFWDGVHCGVFANTFSNCNERDCDITVKAKNAMSGANPARALLLVSPSETTEKTPPQGNIGDGEIVPSDRFDIPILSLVRGDGLALLRHIETGGEPLTAKLLSPHSSVLDTQVTYLDGTGNPVAQTGALASLWTDVSSTEVGPFNVFLVDVLYDTDCLDTDPTVRHIDWDPASTGATEPSAAEKVNLVALLSVPIDPDGNACPVSSWLGVVDDFAGVLVTVDGGAGSNTNGPGGTASTSGVQRFACDADGCFQVSQEGACTEFECLEQECEEYYCEGEGCCPMDLEDINCGALSFECSEEQLGMCATAGPLQGSDLESVQDWDSSALACQPAFDCAQLECLEFQCLEYFCLGEGCSSDAGQARVGGGFVGGCKSKPDDAWDHQDCEGAFWQGQPVDADSEDWLDGDGSPRCYDAPFESEFGYSCLQHGCDEFTCVQPACLSPLCVEYRCKQPACEQFRCSKFVASDDEDVCSLDANAACSEYYTIEDWDSENDPLAVICETFSTTECLEFYTEDDQDVEGGPCAIFDTSESMPETCLQFVDDVDHCATSPLAEIQDAGTERIGDSLFVTGRDIAAECELCARFDDERQYPGDGLTVRKTWVESCASPSLTRCREYNATDCLEQSPTRCKVWDGYAGTGTWNVTCQRFGTGCYNNEYDTDSCSSRSTTRCKTRSDTCLVYSDDPDDCVNTENAILTVNSGKPTYSIPANDYWSVRMALGSGPISVSVSSIPPEERGALHSLDGPKNRRAFAVANIDDDDDVAELLDRTANPNEWLAGGGTSDAPALPDAYGGHFEASCVTTDGAHAYMTWSYSRAGDYLTGDLFARGWERGHTPPAAVVRVSLPDMEAVDILRLDDPLDDPCALSCFASGAVVGVRKPLPSMQSAVLVIQGTEIESETNVPHTACTVASIEEEPVSGEPLVVVAGAAEDPDSEGDYGALLSTYRVNTDTSALGARKTYAFPSELDVTGEEVYRTAAVFDEAGLYLALSPSTGDDAELPARLLTVPGWVLQARPEELPLQQKVALGLANNFVFWDAVTVTTPDTGGEPAKNLATVAVTASRHLVFAAGATLDDNPCAKAARPEDRGTFENEYTTGDCAAPAYIDDFTGFIDVLLVRVDSVEPPTQPSSGGTVVTVRGAGFRNTGQLGVRVRKQSSDEIVQTYSGRYVSANAMRYTASALPADIYYVEVTIDGETFTSTNAAFKTFIPPIINQVAPLSGEANQSFAIDVFGCGITQTTSPSDEPQELKCRIGEVEMPAAILVTGDSLRCSGVPVPDIGAFRLSISLNGGHDYHDSGIDFTYVGEPDHLRVTLETAGDQDKVSDAEVVLDPVEVHVVDTEESTVVTVSDRVIYMCELVRVGANRTESCRSTKRLSSDWCITVTGVVSPWTYCYNWIKNDPSAVAIDVVDGFVTFDAVTLIKPVADDDVIAYKFGIESPGYQVDVVDVGRVTVPSLGRKKFEVDITVGVPYRFTFEYPIMALPPVQFAHVPDIAPSASDRRWEPSDSGPETTLQQLGNRVVVRSAADVVYVSDATQPNTGVRVFDAGDVLLQSRDISNNLLGFEDSVRIVSIEIGKRGEDDVIVTSAPLMSEGELVLSDVTLVAPSVGPYFIRATATMEADNPIAEAYLDLYVVPGLPKRLSILNRTSQQEPAATRLVLDLTVDMIVEDGGANNLFAMLYNGSDYYNTLDWNPTLDARWTAVVSDLPTVELWSLDADGNAVEKMEGGVEAEFALVGNLEDPERHFAATGVALLQPLVGTYAIRFSHPELADEYDEINVRVTAGRATNMTAVFDLGTDAEESRRRLKLPVPEADEAKPEGGVTIMSTAARDLQSFENFDRFAIPAEESILLPPISLFVQDGGQNALMDVDDEVRTINVRLVREVDNIRVPFGDLEAHPDYGAVAVLLAQNSSGPVIAPREPLRCDASVDPDGVGTCLTAQTEEGVADFSGIRLIRPAPGPMFLLFTDPEQELHAFAMQIAVVPGAPYQITPVTDILYIDETDGITSFLGPVLAVVDSVGNLVDTSISGEETIISNAYPVEPERIPLATQWPDGAPPRHDTIGGWAIFTDMRYKGEKEAEYELDFTSNGGELQLDPDHDQNLVMKMNDCPVFSQPNPGETDCRCNAGYQASGEIDEPCIPCLEDSYNDQPGSVCVPCPDRMSTLGIDAADTLDLCYCREDYYRDLDEEELDAQCKECPLGYLDVFKDTIVVDITNPATECRPKIDFFNSTKRPLRINIMGPANITVRPGWWRSTADSLLLHECTLKPIEAALNPPDSEDETMCSDVPHFQSSTGSSETDTSTWYPDTFYVDPATDEPTLIPPECAQCRGGRAGGDDLCGKQYEGPLCNNCAPGYGKNGKFCSACPEDDGTNSAIIMGVLTVVVFVVAGMVWNTIRAGSTIKKNMEKKIQDAKDQLRERKKLHRFGYGTDLGMHHSLKEDVNAQLKFTLLVKIAMNYAQLTSMSADVDIEWPKIVKQLFTYQETLSTPQLQIASVDCALAGRGKHTDDLFFSKWMLYMMLPIMGVTIPAMIWLAIFFIRTLWKTICCGKDKEVKVKKLGEKADWSHYLDMYTVSVLVILFLVHSTVTKQILLMWSCRPLDRLPSGEFEEYLNADLGVSCGTSKHGSYSVAAAFFLFVYSLGIPLMGIFILSRNIKAIRYGWVAEQDPFFDEVLHERKLMAIARFGFLFKGFEQRDLCPYWEVGPVMLRKVFMVFMTVLLADMEPQIRMLFGILLVTVAVLLHVKYSPFDDADLDNLELVSLITSFMTLFLGLFFVVPGVPQLWKLPIAYFIIGLNVLALLMALHSLYKVFVQLKHERKAKSQKKALRAKRVQRRWRRPLTMMAWGNLKEIKERRVNPDVDLEERAIAMREARERAEEARRKLPQTSSFINGSLNQAIMDDTRRAAQKTKREQELLEADFAASMGKHQPGMHDIDEGDEGKAGDASRGESTPHAAIATPKDVETSGLG